MTEVWMRTRSESKRKRHFYWRSLCRRIRFVIFDMNKTKSNVVWPLEKRLLRKNMAAIKPAAKPIPGKENFSFGGKGLDFWVRLVYNNTVVMTQGSYIGNTTASQAVKAGSIPVPCSSSGIPLTAALSALGGKLRRTGNSFAFPRANALLVCTGKFALRGIFLISLESVLKPVECRIGADFFARQGDWTQEF